MESSDLGDIAVEWKKIIDIGRYVEHRIGLNWFDDRRRYEILFCFTAVREALMDR
jgi:hypothetical protein